MPPVNFLSWHVATVTVLLRSSPLLRVNRPRLLVSHGPWLCPQASPMSSNGSKSLRNCHGPKLQSGFKERFVPLIFDAAVFLHGQGGLSIRLQHSTGGANSRTARGHTRSLERSIFNGAPRLRRIEKALLPHHFFEQRQLTFFDEQHQLASVQRLVTLLEVTESATIAPPGGETLR
jgi:hypothetical protein